MRRSKTGSPSWNYLKEIDPDIALLQEVNEIPQEISNIYSFRIRKARNKNGQDQKFGTAVLVKGDILDEINLTSDLDWIKKEIDHFRGNLLAYRVNTKDHQKINIVSVYSPAWCIDSERIQDIDVSGVKLDNNPDIWFTEILWKSLQYEKIDPNDSWVVAGDLNCSLTFDIKWGPRGNDQVIKRIEDLGFYECLRGIHKKVVPTFRTSRGHIEDQIDHLFISSHLRNKLIDCSVGSHEVFDQSLSDHLPVIAEIRK